jgi:GNAT superfamily N-acetyltransferase
MINQWVFSEAGQESMNSSFIITYLANNRQHVETVSAWVLADRKHFYPLETIDDARQRVQASLNSNEIPFTLIALAGGEATGMVSVMKNNAPPGYDKGAFWLASLFAAPEHRGQGLEKALLNRAILEARALSCGELYTWTDSDKDWYQQQGWQVAGTTIFGRRYVGVLRLDLTGGV